MQTDAAHCHHNLHASESKHGCIGNKLLVFFFIERKTVKKSSCDVFKVQYDLMGKHRNRQQHSRIRSGLLQEESRAPPSTVSTMCRKVPHFTDMKESFIVLVYVK